MAPAARDTNVLALAPRMRRVTPNATGDDAERGVDGHGLAVAEALRRLAFTDDARDAELRETIAAWQVIRRNRLRSLPLAASAAPSPAPSCA